MHKLITVLLTICMSSSVFAWGQSKMPQISEVFVNTESNQLTIIGSGFQSPDVSLGEYVDFLEFVSSVGDSELVVKIPDGILAGDYELTLSQGWRGYYRDNFDLTVLSAADGSSCSLTECDAPGVATLTCGATSVTVPCELELLTCLCWNTFTESELVAAMNAGEPDSQMCGFSADIVFAGDVPHDGLGLMSSIGPRLACILKVWPTNVNRDDILFSDAAACREEALTILPQITWCLSDPE